jgi:hypothetical protein
MAHKDVNTLLSKLDISYPALANVKQYERAGEPERPCRLLSNIFVPEKVPAIFLMRLMSPGLTMLLSSKRRTGSAIIKF